MSAVAIISLHSSVTTDSVSRLYITRGASRQNTPSITAVK